MGYFIGYCHNEDLSRYADELVRITLNVIKKEDPNTLAVRDAVTALSLIGRKLDEEMAKVS